MPRVLMILNRLSIGGPIQHVACLTKYLSEHYETLVVVGSMFKGESDGAYILEELGVRYTYVPDMERSIKPHKDIQAYKHLRQIIKDFKPDIVHTHSAKSGFIGRLAALAENVPVIIHTFHGHVFHSYFSKMVTNVFLNIERYLAKKTSATIAISDLQKNDFVNVYKIAPAKKVFVIPLGFELDKFKQHTAENRTAFRSKYFVEEDELAVGIVGRLTKIKNQAMFLEVAKLVKERTNKKVKFFVIGDGADMEPLQQKSAELNLKYSTPETANNNKFNYDVCFTSWIKEMEVAYAGLDIVALTSLNEGTPVTLIEAQAANKPVVSTDVGAVSDTVIEGKTALLSPSNDVEKFTENLLLLIENENLRNKFGQQGNLISKKFGYQRLVKDIRKLYNQLLHKKHRAVLNKNFK